MRYLIYKSGMNKCKIDYRTAFIEGGMASAGNKTLKWICNDSIKVQKYILIEIELSQKMIAEGWRYGQLKKIDLEELEYNNQKRLFMNEVKRFLVFSRSMECLNISVISMIASQLKIKRKIVFADERIQCSLKLKTDISLQAI